MPCVAVLPTYFSTKFGLAVRQTSSGSSLSGAIYSIILYALIDEIGFDQSIHYSLYRPQYPTHPYYHRRLVCLHPSAIGVVHNDHLDPEHLNSPTLLPTSHDDASPPPPVAAICAHFPQAHQ